MKARESWLEVNVISLLCITRFVLEVVSRGHELSGSFNLLRSSTNDMVESKTLLSCVQASALLIPETIAYCCNQRQKLNTILLALPIWLSAFMWPDHRRFTILSRFAGGSNRSLPGGRSREDQYTDHSGFLEQ